MKIGLTFDLVDAYLAAGLCEEDAAEFDRLDTIEGIEKALQSLGHETERIGNIYALVSRLVSRERWDMVFNITEGLRGFGREAQVPALLDAYDIPYTFSDPLVLALTLHKGMTKHVIRDMGIPTADFYVVEAMSDVQNVLLPFPLFAKPVAEGTGKGIGVTSKINDRRMLGPVCKRLLETYHQPVLIETFLSGREFTVGITGTGPKAVAVGAMEVILQEDAEPDVYSYSNKKKFEKVVKYRLVNDAEAQRAVGVALAAWQALGCRDGGRVDIRSDEKGLPHFMEVNPLAGLNPDTSDLPILCKLAGKTFQDLIGDIMASALKRNVQSDSSLSRNHLFPSQDPSQSQA